MPLLSRVLDEDRHRNSRQLEADRLHAEKVEEMRRIREFTCLAMPTLLESINLPRAHAAQLRRQGWGDVESMKRANIEDFIACRLEGHEARRLLMCVRSITDPRRMLAERNAVARRLAAPVAGGQPITLGGGEAADADDGDDEMIRVSNISDLAKASAAGGAVWITRKEAERRMANDTSESGRRLQDSLARRADAARRRAATKQATLLTRNADATAAAAAALAPARPTTPGIVKEVVLEYGWAPGVASVVRSAAHRLAWRWGVAHPADRVFRHVWQANMLKSGKWSADALQPGAWSGPATGAYNDWLSQQANGADNGCERIGLDEAVAEQGERTVEGLALMTHVHKGEGGSGRGNGRNDCPLATHALELAHQQLTEVRLDSLLLCTIFCDHLVPALLVRDRAVAYRWGN